MHNGILRVLLDTGEERKVLALQGFRILGKQARPALPDLLRRVDRSRPENLELLDECFRCMGEGGLRAVRQAGLSPEDWERRIATNLVAEGTGAP